MLEQGDTVRALKGFVFGPISMRTCEVPAGTEGKILSVYRGRSSASYRIDFGVGEFVDISDDSDLIEVIG